MRTMVEKVARAIGISLGEGDTPWEKCGSGFKEICTDAARAAIEAMMEPTPRMISEGESAASIGIGKPADDEALPRVWNWMIQAALKEEAQ